MLQMVRISNLIYNIKRIVILIFSIFVSVANLLGNFSVALTYDLFITLGLITAVPVSAGKYVYFLILYSFNVVIKNYIYEEQRVSNQ